MSVQSIRVLCVGAGHMGTSHARAYAALDGFEICGVVTRSEESRAALLEELGGEVSGFNDFHEALAATKPDAVSISTYPDTHAEYALAAMEAGADVFVEKPLAETVEGAEKMVAKARELGRKVVVGYILSGASQLGEIYRDVAFAGKATGDADELEPTVEWRELGDAQEVDVVDFAGGGLRGALRRCDVSNDALEADSGERNWGTLKQRVTPWDGELWSAAGDLRRWLGGLV